MSNVEKVLKQRKRLYKHVHTHKDQKLKRFSNDKKIKLQQTYCFIRQQQMGFTQHTREWHITL